MDIINIHNILIHNQFTLKKQKPIILYNIFNRNNDIL